VWRRKGTEVAPAEVMCGVSRVVLRGVFVAILFGGVSRGGGCGCAAQAVRFEKVDCGSVKEAMTGRGCRAGASVPRARSRARLDWL